MAAGRRYVRVTPEMAEQAVREIDWARIDAMTDEDIARAVAEDPDAAPLLSDEEALAGRVRLIRRRLGLTQEGFGERFGIPVATVRDWKQARRKPDAALWSYLRVIEREPEAVARALAPPPAA